MRAGYAKNGATVSRARQKHARGAKVEEASPPGASGRTHDPAKTSAGAQDATFVTASRGARGWAMQAANWYAANEEYAARM